MTKKAGTTEAKQSKREAPKKSAAQKTTPRKTATATKIATPRSPAPADFPSEIPATTRELIELLPRFGLTDKDLGLRPPAKAAAIEALPIALRDLYACFDGVDGGVVAQPFVVPVAERAAMTERMFRYVGNALNGLKDAPPEVALLARVPAGMRWVYEADNGKLVANGQEIGPEIADIITGAGAMFKDGIDVRLIPRDRIAVFGKASSNFFFVDAADPMSPVFDFDWEVNCYNVVAPSIPAFLGMRLVQHVLQTRYADAYKLFMGTVWSSDSKHRAATNAAAIARFAGS